MTQPAKDVDTGTLTNKLSSQIKAFSTDTLDSYSSENAKPIYNRTRSVETLSQIEPEVSQSLSQHPNYLLRTSVESVLPPSSSFTSVNNPSDPNHFSQPEYTVSGISPQTHVTYSSPNTNRYSVPSQPHHTINVFNQFPSPNPYQTFQPVQDNYPPQYGFPPPISNDNFYTLPRMNSYNHLPSPLFHPVATTTHLSNSVPLFVPPDVFNSPISPPPPEETPLLTDDDIMKVPPPPPIDFDDLKELPSIKVNTPPPLPKTPPPLPKTPPSLPKTPPPPLTPKRKPIVRPKTKPPPVPSKPTLRSFYSEETLLHCNPQYYQSVRNLMDSSQFDGPSFTFPSSPSFETFGKVSYSHCQEHVLFY